MAGTNYYQLLGIPKTASEDDIKRAYKKMALKWHPDRNQGSEESSKKFKEISEAFEVLSDKQKRTVYDQFGEEGLKGGGGPSPGASAGPGFNFGGVPGGGTSSFSFSTGPGGFASSGGFAPTDPNKIFEQFMSGAFGGMGGMGGMGNRQRMFDNDDDGGPSFSFGGMPGGMPGRTNGRQSQSHPGVRRSTASPSAPQPPSEITRPLKVTLEELYSGAVKHLKVGRRLLNGTTEDKVLEIQIYPGWKSGTKVRFPKAGNEQHNGDSQDLVFVVEEKPHATFTREGNNLVCRLKIPLVDALAGSGGKRTVDVLDGRKLQVPVPSGVVKPGQESTVSGEGMPIRKEGSVKKKGELIVKWDVVFPERLTPSQKEGIRKVLS